MFKIRPCLHGCSQVSTISEVLFTGLLSCKHAHEVWDKVHKHFNLQMKARMHHLCVELKMSKKGSKSIYEYVLRIRAIVDSFLAVDDPISERGQVDAILQGFPEEYNHFTLMVYNKGEPTDIYDVKALLYVQEA